MLDSLFDSTGCREQACATIAKKLDIHHDSDNHFLVDQLVVEQKKLK